MEMIPEIITYAVHYLINTVFLLLALWLMVKIQQFQYNFLGLIGAAALAAGLDMIPHFGHFLAVPVLYGCLLKITREDMTGVIFTAGISYALVFVMNLFLLGSLMGDLRASIGQQPVEMKAVARPAPEESEPDAKPDPDTPAAPQQKANPTTSVSASVAPDKASPAPQSKSSIAGLSLKGVVNSAKNPMAMIASGGKTYDVAVGESVLLEGASGKTKVTLESIEESAVVLNVAGEKVVLRR